MATGLPASLKHIKNFQKPLQFGADGKFRILHLTDIHEVDPDMETDEGPSAPLRKSLETLNVIEKCLDLAKPDLVVFGGDNISGFWEEFTYDYMVRTIEKIVTPVAERNIPLAIVFGNHDSEGEEIRKFLRREIQISFYAEYDNFRSNMNDEDVTGCGNCSLPILSSDGSRVAWNIWCVDSCDYLRDERHQCIKGGGYAHIGQDQIDWYERRAAQLKACNGGRTVPSVLFQHIPVSQEYDLITETDEGTPGAVESGGKYYILRPEAVLDGVMREMPCPPKNDRRQFESWKRTGDVVAAFFGHDHVNTFVAELDGIKLIQTLAAGYHTYGSERGGRLIVLDENISDDIFTETIVVDKLLAD